MHNLITFSIVFTNNFFLLVWGVGVKRHKARGAVPLKKYFFAASLNRCRLSSCLYFRVYHDRGRTVIILCFHSSSDQNHLPSSRDIKSGNLILKKQKRGEGLMLYHMNKKPSSWIKKRIGDKKIHPIQMFFCMFSETWENQENCFKLPMDNA